MHQGLRTMCLLLLMGGHALGLRAQGRVELQLTHWLSHGLPTMEHWRAQAVAKERPVHGFMDRSLTLERPVHGIPIFVEWREQATLSTNQASLVLASQERLESAQLAQGTTQLEGSVRFSRYQSLGVELAHAWAGGSRGLITLRPKLVVIRRHVDDRASGLLTRAGSQLQLSARVSRQSSHSLGFPGMEDQEVAGQGLSTDWRLQVVGNIWELHAGMSNALAWIRPGTTHVSVRNYQITTHVGRIEPGREPSMTGVFGSASQAIKLPRTGHAVLSVGSSSVAAIAGAHLVAHHGIGFWGAKFRHSNHEFMLSRGQGGNTDVGWTMGALAASPWSFSAGMIFSPQGKGSLARLSAVAHF